MLPLLFVLFWTTPLYSQTISLKTDFQDTASKVIKDASGKYVGICIDLMNLIEKNSGFKFIYPKDFSPLKRIEADLGSGDIDVYFALIKNPAREKFASFIEPLYTIDYILIAKADEKADIKTIDDLKTIGKNGKILTVGGSTIVNYIEKTLGLPADSSAATVNQNLSKLLAGRERFMIYQDLSILYEMTKPEYKDKFKIYPLSLQKEELWLVTSKKQPDSTGKSLQAVIKKLKASGDWDKIVSKYTSITK